MLGIWNLRLIEIPRERIVNAGYGINDDWHLFGAMWSVVEGMPNDLYRLEFIIPDHTRELSQFEQMMGRETGYKLKTIYGNFPD